jgi:hypothetical protein
MKITRVSNHFFFQKPINTETALPPVCAVAEVLPFSELFVCCWLLQPFFHQDAPTSQRVQRQEKGIKAISQSNRVLPEESVPLDVRHLPNALLTVRKTAISAISSVPHLPMRAAR